MNVLLEGERVARAEKKKLGGRGFLPKEKIDADSRPFARSNGMRNRSRPRDKIAAAKDAFQPGVLKTVDNEILWLVETGVPKAREIR
jgi:hypothetical protein